MMMTLKLTCIVDFLKQSNRLKEKEKKEKKENFSKVFPSSSKQRVIIYGL
jgi:hypothetical protein